MKSLLDFYLGFYLSGKNEKCQGKLLLHQPDRKTLFVEKSLQACCGQRQRTGTGSGAIDNGKVKRTAVYSKAGSMDPYKPMGISTGAGVVLTAPFKHQGIKKILLIAPGTDLGRFSMMKGTRNFHGKLYVLMGACDPIREKMAFLKEWSCASKLEIKAVPGCDHHFAGTIELHWFFRFFLTISRRFPRPNPDTFYANEVS